MPHLLKYAIVFLFSIGLNNIALATDQKLYYFNIQEQPLDKALISASQQANISLIFNYNALKDYYSTPLKGYYSGVYALERILRESPFKLAQNDGKYFIEPRQFLSQAKYPTSTVVAEKQTQQNAPSNENQVEIINIVGKKALARSLSELPTPVDVFSRDDLLKTGHNELGKVLQALAPSFNFSSSAISDGTDAVQPATLRGLGPDQTLLLINGRRRHQAALLHINSSVGRGTTGVDINAIPVDAIERIEILRDGATAKYGSDAIAGVINIVLAQHKRSGFKANTGIYTKRDGLNQKVSLYTGTELSDSGHLSATVSLKKRNSTNRSGLHGSCLYFNCNSIATDTSQSDDVKEISANRNTFRIGDAQFDQVNAVINTAYGFGNSNIYGYLTTSDRSNESAAFYRAPNESLSNPLLADGDATYIDGFLPIIEAHIKDHSINLGFSQDLLASTTLDLSYTYGKNTIDYKTKNSLNASYINALHLEQKYTPEQIRKSFPTEADAYSLMLSLEKINLEINHYAAETIFSVGVEERRDVYQIRAGEKYGYFDYDEHSLNQPNLAHGIQGFPGISPQDEVRKKRQIISLYADLSTEISESFSLEAAARFDNYSSFANTSNIKLAGNWAFNEQLKFRLGYNTGFRAPSMQQLYFRNRSTQYVVNTDGEVTGETIATVNNSEQLAFTGIPKLKEEESKNINIGLSIQEDNWQFTLDMYHIAISDRIVISNQLCRGEHQKLDALIDELNVDKMQVFLNGANTTTRGIDLVSVWQHNNQFGQFTTTLSANYTDTEVTDLYTSDDSVLSALSTAIVFSEQDKSIIESWQPNHKILFVLNWKVEDWHQQVSINRYGSYTILDGEAQRFSAKTLVNWRLEHQLRDNFNWHLGVNNIFDITPDQNNIGNSNQGRIVTSNGEEIVNSAGVFQYSRRSAPFGFNGRFVYLGANWQF